MWSASLLSARVRAVALRILLLPSLASVGCSAPGLPTAAWRGDGGGQTTPVVAALQSVRTPGRQGDPSPADPEAARLAERLRAGGPAASSALGAALRRAGFVVGSGGGGSSNSSPRFDAYEVDALVRLAERRISMPFGDLARLVGGLLSMPAGAPVEDLLLDGIRAQARGGDPSLRAWATFIVELGRQADEPYDLLAAGPPPVWARFDAVQTTLVLRRVAADLRGRAVLASGGQQRGSLPGDLFDGADGGPRFALARAAAWPGPGLLRLTQAPAGWASLPDCSLPDDGRAPTGDEAAAGLTFGFGKLLEYLEDHWPEAGETIGKISSFVGSANLVSAYTKLLATYWAFNADIAMSGAGPLVRTKDRHRPGERRELTATVRMDTGNLQAVNCARLALNVLGLDLEVPSNGAVEGAVAEWVGVSNVGVRVDTRGDYGITPGIVEFEIANIANAVSSSRTDGRGVARLGVHGAPQPEPVPECPRAPARCGGSSRSASTLPSSRPRSARSLPTRRASWAGPPPS